MIFDVYIEKAFIMVIIFSGLPLIAISLISLFVSTLQAVTQIQEQSIGFLVKFLSLSLIIMFLGAYFIQNLTFYFQDLLQSISFLGRN